MGIVQLHSIVVGEAAQVIAVGSLEGPQHILQRGRGQHILLLDAQTLALPGGVIGVENTGDILSLVLLVQSPQVILVVESTEIQFFLGLALPQAQGVDIVGAIADDGHIIGHSQDGVIRELDLHGVVVPAVGPGVAELGPVVRVLLLAALVIEALLEQAELIPQAIAGQGDVAGGSAVQEAGSKTTESAVSETWFRFLFFNISKSFTCFGKRITHIVIKTEIDQIVGQ